MNDLHITFVTDKALLLLTMHVVQYTNYLLISSSYMRMVWV